MIFLDTDTISYFFNGNILIGKKIQQAMKEDEQVCVTSINVYEVLKGLKYKENEKILKGFQSLFRFVEVFFFDTNAAEIASKIYAELRKKGRPIGDADILIASIVIKNKGILVTNNTKHYKNIEGLIIENWLN
ncbi:MAG: type II toxin-antitoxin system VapC family toxin [Oscillospiraceae bacterium]|nr:type II toxin-antitoxin system VapC family toxin [Oscillospiraceae bacterium]